VTGDAVTAAQRQALAQLRKVAKGGRTPLQRVWSNPAVGVAGLALRLRLSTAGITVADGGLPVNPVTEDVTVVVPPAFPWRPPSVFVEHTRFVGYPHVLAGTELCIYLDQSQEWHPNVGVPGFLNRLWQWFVDAAAGTFDARRALFHPVGGVSHQTEGTPTLVVRHPVSASGTGLWRCALRQRTTHRLDLVPIGMAEPEDLFAQVLNVAGPLRYGAGTTIRELLRRLELVGTVNLSALLQALGATALRNPSAAPLYMILAVPGGPLEHNPDRHLICARLPARFTETLRGAVQRNAAVSLEDAAQLDIDAPVEWCPVSEERRSMTKRRDSTRPVSLLEDKHIVLWGCGGLGSWVGEFVARAGAARITLADPGTVTGGLLVRQNYIEEHIGQDKADALAERLRAIRDDLKVEVTSAIAGLTDGSLPDCHVLIDCTVNNSVAAVTSTIWDTTKNVPLVARMATDRATSTLGLLTVTRPTDRQPPPGIADRQAGQAVSVDPSLDGYACFWDEPLPSEELLAEPGCSVPTFHGSAADLAAIAAVLTNLLASHLTDTGIAGSHLVALPHAMVTVPAHQWLPC
jgi:hypothetical protein